MWLDKNHDSHEVTHREVAVPQHRDEPSQEPNEYPCPGLDQHVGHRSNCHTPCQCCILDVGLCVGIWMCTKAMLCVWRREGEELWISLQIRFHQTQGL